MPKFASRRLSTKVYLNVTFLIVTFFAGASPHQAYGMDMSLGSWVSQLANSAATLLGISDAVEYAESNGHNAEPQPAPLVKGDLAFEMNSTIQHWVKFFSSTDRGRVTMQTALQRSGRYVPMAQEIFAREGVPTDLIFLAQAESTWLPKVNSPVKARGLWQFMPATGAEFGLEQNQWIDERSDPEQSTVAAAKYLKQLYRQFDDWPLAMAAYNVGPGRVSQVLKSSGAKSFWELHARGLLPTETRNYVPVILAIITVAKDHQAHGFQIDFAPALNYDTLAVDGQMSLQLIAESAGTSLPELIELNPQFQQATTAPSKAQKVYVPKGAAQKVIPELETVAVNQNAAWRVRDLSSNQVFDSIGETATR